ncbi:MAG: Hsp20/alpha crystallin family protein, partial [Myxococcota bacterium]
TPSAPRSRSIEATTSRVRPPANVAEHSEAYHLQLRMPGVAKGGVELEAEKGVLRVRAVSEVATPEGLRARLREFSATRFERDFALPKDVDPNAIEARLEAGILTVILPKRQELQARSITIG